MSAATPPRPSHERADSREAARDRLWERVYAHVRAFAGAKTFRPELADEIAQRTMARLWERAHTGEDLRNLEAAAIEDTKFQRRGYWREQSAEARALRTLRAVARPDRGQRVAGPSGHVLYESEGPRTRVRLGDTPTRGRPPRSSPRRRMPVRVYLPDGSELVLTRWRDQRGYKSVSQQGVAPAWRFVVLAYTDLPAAPWDATKLQQQAADRERWRECEASIRAPQRRR